MANVRSAKSSAKAFIAGSLPVIIGDGSVSEPAIESVIQKPQPTAAARAGRSGIPAYVTIQEWCRYSGMGRSTTYEALARGDLRAVKLGARTLVDVAPGLTWLDSLPPAAFRPHGAKRTKQAA